MLLPTPHNSNQQRYLKYLSWVWPVSNIHFPEYQCFHWFQMTEVKYICPWALSAKSMLFLLHPHVRNNINYLYISHISYMVNRTKLPYTFSFITNIIRVYLFDAHSTLWFWVPSYGMCSYSARYQWLLKANPGSGSLHTRKYTNVKTHTQAITLHSNEWWKLFRE